MSKAFGCIMACNAQLLASWLAVLCDCIHRAGAQTLQISFGSSSAAAGYEAVSASSMYTQWSGGAKYFGSCFGGHWFPPVGAAANAQSDGSALGSWNILASDTYYCVLSVPPGSYQIEVIAGNTPTPSSTCLSLSDGTKVLETSIAAGMTQVGRAVIQKETLQSCLSLRACAADSVLNVWRITRLPCHASCSYCTGASLSQCTIGCNEGRALVMRDGGSYCDAQVPQAPPRPATSAITKAGLTLSWAQPITGGSEITGYRIRSSVSEFAVLTEFVANTHTSSTSFQVTGLESNTIYTFAVAAINAMGVGGDSPRSTPITTLPDVPDPPAAGWMENITSSSLAVVWSEPAKANGRPVTMYIIQISEGQDEFRDLLNTSALTATLTNLLGATPYRVRVLARNEIGLSEPREVSGESLSNASAITLQPVAPSPPSITSLKFAAPYEAVLTWASPEDHGGRPVLKYTVSAAPAVGDAERLEVVARADEPFSVQFGQLLGSTTYSFQVTATNSVGISDAARIVATTPAPIQAAAPGTPTVSNAEQYSLDLVWAEPSHDGGSRIIGYRVWIQILDVWSIAVDCNNTCGNSTTISSLQGNTGYRFRSQALTTFGLGLRSSASELAFTAPVHPYQPGKPWAHSSHHYELRLAWDAPANDGGLDVLAYMVWMRSSNDLDWIVAVNSTESNDTTIVLQGLQANTAYIFMVAALNTLGLGERSVSSEPVTASPRVPDSPAAPLITQITWYSMRVEWAAPTTDGGRAINGYRLEQSLEAAEFQEIFSTSTDSVLAFDVMGLAAATLYQFRVIARNTIGSSEPSIAANATTASTTIFTTISTTICTTPSTTTSTTTSTATSTTVSTTTTSSRKSSQFLHGGGGESTTGTESGGGGSGGVGGGAGDSGGGGSGGGGDNGGDIGSGGGGVDGVGDGNAGGNFGGNFGGNAGGNVGGNHGGHGDGNGGGGGGEPNHGGVGGIGGGGIGGGGLGSGNSGGSGAGSGGDDGLNNGAGSTAGDISHSSGNNDGGGGGSVGGGGSTDSNISHGGSNADDGGGNGGLAGGDGSGDSGDGGNNSVNTFINQLEETGTTTREATDLEDTTVACPLGMATDGLQCVTECKGTDQILALRRESGGGLACVARVENSNPVQIAFTFSRIAPFPVDVVERLLRAVESATTSASAAGERGTAEFRFGVTQVTIGNSVQRTTTRPSSR